MELWIAYALVAAIFIACRDIFTKEYSKKYSATEHVLYYYVLTGVIVISYTLYQKYVRGEKIRCIEADDLWKYVVIAGISVVLISPCEALSLKKCDNPGKSKAIVNLNTIFAFLISIILIRGATMDMRAFFGIALTIIGVYFVV